MRAQIFRIHELFNRCETEFAVPTFAKEARVSNGSSGQQHSDHWSAAYAARARFRNRTRRARRFFVSGLEGEAIDKGEFQ
jgi:hypothetical protein